MRKLVRRDSLLSVSFSVLFFVVAVSIVPAKTVHEHVPGEMLVTMRGESSEAVSRATLGSAGHSILKRFQLHSNSASRLNRLYHVRAKPGQSLDAALHSVRRLPEVEAAQPNYIYRAQAVPNDPYYYLQWGMENTGDDSAHTAYGLHGPDPRVSDTDIDYEEASEIWAGMPFDTVVVGIIDSGIDLDHPDLARALWTNPGRDFVANDNDPDDEEGHGTHAAGVIAGDTDNGTGVAGTSPNAALMCLPLPGS